MHFGTSQTRGSEVNKITIIEVIQNVGVFKEIGKIKHFLKFSYDFQLSLKKLEVKPQT